MQLQEIESVKFNKLKFIDMSTASAKSIPTWGEVKSYVDNKAGYNRYGLYEWNINYVDSTPVDFKTAISGNPYRSTLVDGEGFTDGHISDLPITYTLLFAYAKTSTEPPTYFYTWHVCSTTVPPCHGKTCGGQHFMNDEYYIIIQKSITGFTEDITLKITDIRFSSNINDCSFVHMATKYMSTSNLYALLMVSQ